MTFRTQLLIFLILYAMHDFASAQQKICLKIHSEDSVSEILLKKAGVKKCHKSRSAAYQELNRLMDFAGRKGYHAASLDSLRADSMYVYVKFYSGTPLTSFHVLLQGDLPPRFNDNDIILGASQGHKAVANISEEIIRYWENRGYPFAEVHTDSIASDGDVYYILLRSVRNEKVMIDSVIIRGNLRISRSFMRNYTGLRSGGVFNESEVKKLDQRLRNLAFVNLTRATAISFTPGKAKIYVHLDKKKASTFNGVIGFLPNNKVSGKLMLTGEVKLGLLNAFGAAETIDLHWRQPSPETQDLRAGFTYPYFLGTPFGPDYRFKLYKKDTSYITVNHNIGLIYLMKAGSWLRLFTDFFTSSLISTSGLEATTVLPSYADISTSLFGVEYSHDKLDYRLNPSRGYSLLFSAAAGNRKIRKNNAVNPVVYENLDETSSQLTGKSAFSVFIPLANRISLLLSNQNAGVFNERMFENELMFLGGLQSLRGFDEESIRVSSYVLGNAELRYRFEQNSYLSLFANGAWVERKLPDQYYSDIPWGVGAGLAFDTRAGIFTLNYALGSEQGNPLSFRTAKIHFGIRSYF